MAEAPRRGVSGSSEARFRPAAAVPLDHPVGLVKTGRMMRENPLSILPSLLFEQTIVSGPYLGRTVHELSGPDEMRTVLQDDFDSWRKSPLIVRMLRPVLGDAILTAHGESWRRQRMALQPAFLKRRIDRFAPVMADAAASAVERLADADGPVEVQAVMTDATFAVIERALFSDVEAFDRGEVRQAIEVLLEEIGTMRMSDLVPFPEWVPRLMGPRALRARHVFRSAARAQIERRRATDEPGEDLLGLLLTVRDEETGATLSDVDIRDTLMTFIAAGHETTAIALTWTLYLVANDPSTQVRLQEEADAVLGGRPPRAEDVANLAFARQVIEESMRLFPPAPIVGRRAMRDTEVGGRPVKKGDVALLAFYALHRNKRLWDDPGEFDPDRFSPERRPRDRYLFMPFGGGPRACLGAQFAMMEAVIMLASFAANLRFEPAHGEVRPVMQVTMRPEGGMPLRVVRR